jgi:hypothetical protein
MACSLAPKWWALIYVLHCLVTNRMIYEIGSNRHRILVNSTYGSVIGPDWSTKRYIIAEECLGVVN